jgi:hypothetical protein
MVDILKSLTNKITRDLAYPIGGGTVIGCAWLTFSAQGTSIELLNTSIIVQVLLIGIAYVVGFVVQELFSLIPGFSTTLYIKNWRCWFRCSLRWLYTCYTRECFSHQERGFSDAEVYKILDGNLENSVLKDVIDRTATLKHIGTCIGPCFIVGGFFLCFIICRSKVTFITCLSLLLVGLFLFVIVGRLKTMQEISYLRCLETELRSSDAPDKSAVGISHSITG